MVARDRFGGLFSVLSRRDVQTLKDFEVWYRDYASDFIDEDAFIEQEAGFSDRKEPVTVDNLLTHSTEDILAFIKSVREEMAWMCASYGLEDYSLPYDTSDKPEQLRQCRHWIAKLDPIIKKLTKVVDRLRNEALD